MALGSLDQLEGGGLQENSMSRLPLVAEGAGAPAPACVPTQGGEVSGSEGALSSHSMSHPVGANLPLQIAGKEKTAVCWELF